MVQRLIETDDDSDPRIGSYSGLLAACFPAAQIFTAQWWGYLSDRIGRRPVLFIGMIGKKEKIFYLFLSFSCCDINFFRDASFFGDINFSGTHLFFG